MTLRPAAEQDSRQVWTWRSDPVSRAVSGDSEPIPWSSHQQWFAQVLRDPRRHLLILTQPAGEDVGVLRFDELDDEGAWQVSINLSPAARGRGLGAVALQRGESWLRARASPQRLVAEIRADNVASLRTFERAGYALSLESDGWRRYERTVG